MTTANDPWGRVDDDGTVYVRTADGERVIGSWAAGSPEEALAFYRRKFQSLETEVTLIEQRMSATEIAPAQAQATVQRLLRTVAETNAIGDLDSLRVRLEGLTITADQRREEVKAAREQSRQEARETKERIAAEAEQIAAEATHWKASGERMAELLEEWKAAPHADRAVEAVLWKRLSAARNLFTKRRKAYFSSMEAEREAVRVRKEKIVEEAEVLADSTDWSVTSSAYRELMRQWKEVGRADRDAEAELWKRFRDAQDKFFAARTEVFAARADAFKAVKAVPAANLNADLAITIYLSDEDGHERVEAAVEDLLISAGFRITEKGEPIVGSWFRRMSASVVKAAHSPAAREAALTAAHAADTRLVLAQDAAITATLLQNLGPVIASLHSTKDAVIRMGSVLLVKVDWVITVHQLTAAQQAILDHQPRLVTTPHEVIAALSESSPDGKMQNVALPERF